MRKIRIGGRDIPLLFDMGAMEQGLTVFGSMSEFHAAMEHQEGRNMISDVISLILILGNNALEAEGKPQDLTHVWLKHNLHIRDLQKYLNILRDCIDEGMRREITEDSEGPVDAYLAEDETAKNA